MRSERLDLRSEAQQHSQRPYTQSMLAIGGLFRKLKARVTPHIERHEINTA